MNTGFYYKLMADGFIKPEDAEPEVQGFTFYLDAFRELSTSRPSGLEIQAIPFTAIAEYFRIYELSDFDEFAYIIRQMDNAFMDMHLASTSKPKEKKKNASPNTDSKNTNKGRHV